MVSSVTPPRIEVVDQSVLYDLGPKKRAVSEMTNKVNGAPTPAPAAKPYRINQDSLKENSDWADLVKTSKAGNETKEAYSKFLNVDYDNVLDKYSSNIKKLGTAENESKIKENEAKLNAMGINCRLSAVEEAYRLSLGMSAEDFYGMRTPAKAKEETKKEEKKERTYIGREHQLAETVQMKKEEKTPMKEVYTITGQPVAVGPETRIIKPDNRGKIKQGKTEPKNGPNVQTGIDITEISPPDQIDKYLSRRYPELMPQLQPEAASPDKAPQAAQENIKTTIKEEPKIQAPKLVYQGVSESPQTNGKPKKIIVTDQKFKKLGVEAVLNEKTDTYEIIHKVWKCDLNYRSIAEHFYGSRSAARDLEAYNRMVPSAGIAKPEDSVVVRVPYQLDDLRNYVKAHAKPTSVLGRFTASFRTT